MLEESLRKYQNRLVESTVIIQELINLAKDITQSSWRRKRNRTFRL